MHIDAIQQGAGDAVAVALDLIRRTMTTAATMAKITAGAGIHGRDQLKTRREFGLPGGARDRDAS